MTCMIPENILAIFAHFISAQLASCCSTDKINISFSVKTAMRFFLQHMNWKPTRLQDMEDQSQKKTLDVNNRKKLPRRKKRYNNRKRKGNKQQEPTHTMVANTA